MSVLRQILGIWSIPDLALFVDALKTAASGKFPLVIKGKPDRRHDLLLLILGKILTFSQKLSEPVGCLLKLVFGNINRRKPPLYILSPSIFNLNWDNRVRM